MKIFFKDFKLQMNLLNSLQEKIKNIKRPNEGILSSSIGDTSDDQSDIWLKDTDSDLICPTLV